VRALRHGAGTISIADQEALLKTTRTRLGAAASVLGIAALALAACGSAPSDSKDDAKGSSDFTGCIVSDSGGFDDQSFNQTSYEGLQTVVKDKGITLKKAESNADSDFEPNLNGMVKAGCDITYAVGFNLAKATKKVADANPKSHFALLDDNSATGKNIKNLTYETDEATFLAGYVAAAQSKTGKVATFGGQKIPTVTIFMEGFAEGVAQYNKDNNKNVKVLGWNSAKQDGTFTNDFTSQDKGKNITKNFLDQGADIVMPVAGPVGLGAAAAVQESKKAGNEVALVWVDADGYKAASKYKSLMLTSAVKSMDKTVEDITAQAIDGKFNNKPYVGTLKNGGVSIAPFHDFDSKVSDKTKKAVEDLKAKIISGEVKVGSKN
jgi:basic membrane protein A